jgi:tripartite-type tricarboxylate transporter receptor subunit TctC
MKAFALAAAAVAAWGLSVAAAQDFPTRPMTSIVPFAAGGPTDIITRLTAEHMRGTLGQPIIVENVVGAGGTIGVGRVARAAPDGHTMVLGNWGSFAVTGAIYTLPYDLRTDFEPIAPVATEPLLVCAKQSAPPKNLRELLDWVKANDDKLSMATSGIGGPSHMAGVVFQQMTGTRFQMVPYRGAAPATQALVAGQHDFGVYGPAAVLPLARAGTIKCHAVTAARRLTAAPEYPTVDEAGLPGLHLSVWHGYWVPKNTPQPIVAKLNAAVVAALADVSVVQRLRDLGQEFWPREQQTPAVLAAFHRAEIERWWPIVKAAGIKPQ